MDEYTPSKIVIEASPIPQTPLTMTKRARQSVDILNSKEKIDVAKIKKNKENIMLDKINKTETTEKKNLNRTNRGTKDMGVKR